MTTPLILRASAVAAYKACPTRFRYRYVENIVPDKETEATRVGSSWHALMEVYRKAYAAATMFDDAGELVAADHVNASAQAQDAAITHLNERYADCPTHIDLGAWEIERTILAYSFMGYLWYWQNDTMETLATEFGFTLPLHHPVTGMPLRTEDVVRSGTIDRLVRRNGVVSVADYKSTSQSIEQDSRFWDHLRLDTQISMYVMAAQELAAVGELLGTGPGDEVAGAFYDVWHKPTIKPAKLTQKDTLEFVETGKYCSVDFVVTQIGVGTANWSVLVNGVPAEIEEGKKGFAIRETAEMFGARLLQDITERPTFYFARREIPRTQKDITNFRHQLYNVYQSMKSTIKGGHYFQNERQCEATFHCPYIPICYAGRDIAVDGLPEGMKHETVQITVERGEI